MERWVPGWLMRIDVLLALCAAASAALLAGAHAFERLGGLAPCPLCLDQREAHWTALAVALVGLGAARITRSWLAATAALGALALVYAFSAGLSFYHSGVEWDFWAGPATCSGGPTAVSEADLLSALSGGPVDAPACDEAAWRMLGVSMAGYNFLVSAALCLAAAAAAAGSVRRAVRRSPAPA